MEKGKEKMSPDGYVQIDEVIKDISSLTHQYSNDIMLVRLLNQLISKLNIAKEIICFLPKLPLHQTEQAISSLCRKDTSLHGVQVLFLFKTRSQNTDYAKIGKLTFNIEKP